MNSFLLFVGGIALINFILALIVYQRNSHSWVNKSFVFFAGTLSLWTLSIGFLFTFKTLFWSDLTLFFGNLFGVSSFILFSKHFPEGHKLNIKYLIYFCVIPVALFLILTPFHPFVSGINSDFDQIQPVLGVLYPLLMLWSVFGAIFGSVTLFKKFRNSTGRPRNQIKFLFFGFFSFLFAVTLTGVILPAVGISRFGFFSPAATLLLVGFTSYAIIRHRLMDIRLIIVRAVSFVLVLVVIGILYSLLVIGFGTILVDLSLTQIQFATLISLTFVASFTFTPLRKLFESVSSRIFYKNSYNSDKVLSEISKILAGTLNLQDMTGALFNELEKSLKITKSAVLLLAKNNIHQTYHKNFQVVSDMSEDDFELLQSIQSKLQIFDEISEGNVKELFIKYGIYILVKLKTETELGVYFILGQKESGDIFTEQDLSVISILASESAIAFQNARSYEEIRRFNITLQEEVEKATKELKEANSQLQELDKLKDEFVSLASHELRTPMAAIKGSISTILEGYAGPISNDSREFLTAAYNENDRLIRLVNNLLNTSRIESGKLSFTLSHVQLSELIADVVKNLKLAVKEKHLYITYEQVGELPLVIADEDKIKEVVINLISNALKFTSEGGITIKTEVKDGMVVTQVKDTGTGIHKEDFDLLFKKFSQVKRDQKYTKTYGGTGLGLYLSQKIIEGLGGSIWLDSEVGKGTTFYFTLPIVK